MNQEIVDSLKHQTALQMQRIRLPSLLGCFRISGLGKQDPQLVQGSVIQGVNFH